MKKLIAQGAEAKLYRDKDVLIKDRVPKSYRLKVIDDKVRILRTRKEARMLERASKLIDVPKVISVDESSGKIVMEFVPGKKIADVLDSLKEEERLEVCRKIGNKVAVLHNNGVVHGDLTTSNMILSKERIFFVDFGLSFVEDHVEHKAVDLHVLNEALESKHWCHYDSSFRAVINGYLEIASDGKNVMERLKVVELRGRYKRKGS